MNELSTNRRAPATYALALVITLTAVGVLLRWWGPMNPSVAFGVTTENGSGAAYGVGMVDPSWGNDGKAQVTLNLDNGSHSPVTVRRIRVIQTPDSNDLPLPTLVVHAKQTDATRVSPNHSAFIDVTLTAAKGCEAWLAKQAAAEPMTLPMPQRYRNGTFSLVVDLATSSGRTKTVGGEVQFNGICPDRAFMPSPGVQPQNVAVAKHAVTVAFWTAYDSRNGLEERVASIDNVAGIPPAGLPDGIPSRVNGGIRSQVHDVVFTSPTKAAVLYDVFLDGNPTLTDRLGHARLVEGTWKVTRATVCDDLAVAGVHCS